MDKTSLKIGLIALVGAICLSTLLVKDLSASGDQNSDVLMQVMGGTAQLASDKAYQEADTYFHGGVADVDCPDHPGDRRSDVSCPDKHEETGGIETVSSELPLAGFIDKIQTDITPHRHVHVKGQSEKEVLPWFVASVRLNPHNIDGWRDGAFWFYRTKEYRESEKFLLQGIRHNPSDYRLYLDAGIFYHRIKNWDKAQSCFESAERLWKNNNSDADTDRRAIGIYLKYERNHSMNIQRSTSNVEP